MGRRCLGSNRPSDTSMISTSLGNRFGLCDLRTEPSPRCGRSGWPSRPILFISRCTTRWDPGVIQRRHGHLSPHVVMVLDGEIVCGERRCPAGTHIELPKQLFGPFEAGDEGATLFEVMMGDPRGWGDDPRILRAPARAARRRASSRPPDRAAAVARGPPRALDCRRDAEDLEPTRCRDDTYNNLPPSTRRTGAPLCRCPITPARRSDQDVGREEDKMFSGLWGTP